MTPSRARPHRSTLLLVLRLALLVGFGVLVVRYTCLPLVRGGELVLLASLAFAPGLWPLLARWGRSTPARTRRYGAGLDLFLVSLLNVLALGERGVPLFFPLYIVVYLAALPAWGWRGVLGSAGVAVVVLLGGGVGCAVLSWEQSLAAAGLAAAWAPVAGVLAAGPEVAAPLAALAQRRRPAQPRPAAPPERL